MYGIAGTECKIAGCSNPVWPSKTAGFCSTHYGRNKTGRMRSDGTLEKHIPVVTCVECGKVFTGTHKQNHMKVCTACRTERYNFTKLLNKDGIHRRNTGRDTAHKLEYVRRVLTTIIRGCKNIERYKPVVEMRASGMTYKEIAVHFGVSYQRIHQICTKYYGTFEECEK